MERINVFLSTLTLKRLKELPGTISEHIRRAIDEYLTKYSDSSTSRSKKGGV